MNPSRPADQRVVQGLVYRIGGIKKYEFKTGIKARNIKMKEIEGGGEN